MIKFTKASLEDARELTDIQIETFDDDTRKFFNRPNGGPPGYDSLEAQIDLLNNNIFYKIVDHDDIVGGIILTAKDEEHYELTRMYIVPDLQSKGIGQKAIEFIESEFPHIKKWTLDTPSVCTRNHHFYEKMGYKKVNEILINKSTSLYLYFYEKIMSN